MDNKLNATINYFIEYETSNRLNDVYFKNENITTISHYKLMI